MKKFLIVLLLCILILSGFRAFAIPHDKQIENEPLNMQQYKLEITIKGGFLGYTILVRNTGIDRVCGNLSIEILTDAMVVIFGENLTGEYKIELDPLSKIEKINLRPLIGFGSASMSISGVFADKDGEYTFEKISDGYAFVILIVCDETEILIP